jgi:hypothetical protein
VFRHYIAIFRERSLCLLIDAQLRSSRKNIVDGRVVSSDVVRFTHPVTIHKIGGFVGFSSIFLREILIFKELVALRLCKSFGVKGLIR